MSSQTVIHDLRGPCVNVFENVPAQDIHQACLSDTTRCNLLGLQGIALDDIASSTYEKEKGVNHTKLLDILTDLWDILFPRNWKETYRRLEGEDMPPVVVYKYTGTTFVQAEVWDYLRRWR